MTTSSPRSVQQTPFVPRPLPSDLPPPYLPPKDASPTTPTSPTSVHSPSSTQSHTTWLSALLSTKFYGPCPHHPGLRKNDQNLFCTTHAIKICQYCHRAHHTHTPSCTLLHVSRYMYHDVLLAREASALLPLTHVQSYLNNGNRVVYIDRRAQPPSKLPPHARSCVVCERTLQDPYRFCSVFCSLVFANDPAAHPQLPIPDATPLPHLPIRRPNRKLDQSPKSSPKSSPSSSPTSSPSSHPTSHPSAQHPTRHPLVIPARLSHISSSPSTPIDHRDTDTVQNLTPQRRGTAGSGTGESRFRQSNLDRHDHDAQRRIKRPRLDARLPSASVLSSPYAYPTRDSDRPASTLALGRRSSTLVVTGSPRGGKVRRRKSTPRPSTVPSADGFVMTS